MILETADQRQLSRSAARHASCPQRAHHQHEQRDRGERQSEEQHHPTERRQCIVLGGGEDQVRGVCDVVEKEERAFPAGDGVTGEKDRQAGERGGGHHRYVEGKGGGRDADPGRRHEARDAEHAQDVEDAAADDVANGDVALATDRRHDRRGDLRSRGPGSHDGQSDHELGYADDARHRYCGVDQPVRAQHQQSQAASDQKRDVERHAARGPHLAALDLVCAGPSRRASHI